MGTGDSVRKWRHIISLSIILHNFFFLLCVYITSSREIFIKIENKGISCTSTAVERCQGIGLKFTCFASYA